MIAASMTCPSCGGVLVRREVEPDVGGEVPTYTLPAEHRDHQVVSVQVSLRERRSVWWICTGCRNQLTAYDLVKAWADPTPIVPGSLLADVPGLIEVVCRKCSVHYPAPASMAPLYAPEAHSYAPPPDVWRHPIPVPWNEYIVDGRWVMCPSCERAYGCKYALEVVNPPEAT